MLWCNGMIRFCRNMQLKHGTLKVSQFKSHAATVSHTDTRRLAEKMQICSKTNNKLETALWQPDASLIYSSVPTGGASGNNKKALAGV